MKIIKTYPLKRAFKDKFPLHPLNLLLIRMPDEMSFEEFIVYGKVLFELISVFE